MSSPAAADGRALGSRHSDGRLGPFRGSARTVPAPIVSTLVVTVALLLVTVALPPPALAAARHEPRPGSEVDALALLARAVHAHRTVGYTGVQFVSTWSPSGTASFVVDVDHMPRAGTTLSVRGTTTGPQGVSFSVSPDDVSPDDVSPDGAESLPDTAAGVSRGSVGPDLALLSSNYTILILGTDSVAGRPATVVELRRASDAPAARFWVDTQSGLMLRREVYDRHGATIRASAFIDLRPARQAFLRHMPPPLPNPWREDVATVAVTDLADLEAQGWICPSSVAASLSLRHVRLLEDEHGRIVHLTYSDGLSTASVFEQRGHLDVERLEGYRATRLGSATVYVDDGMPQRFVWSAEGTVYTLIADAPAETVEQVVAALPHASEDNGVVPRIRRGMDRAISWFSPNR